MKLDVSIMRFLNKEDFQVLSAVETGMRNHDMVPTELIVTIAGVGGAHKILSNLLRHKLLFHDNKEYDGYRLTYSGYDFLALKYFLQKGLISAVGRQIGVGKESDIFIAQDEDGQELVLKLQRLGRVSFRSIKKKRDYLAHRKSASWMYMSKLAAAKEFAFMTALHDADFPVPTPVAHNRHAVLMTLVKGRTLVNLRAEHIEPLVPSIFDQAVNLLKKLADLGLIHCDFNEFNLIVNPDTGHLTMIDFPQMVSRNHKNADELFNRDMECVVTYFKKRYRFAAPEYPLFAGLPPQSGSLDAAVEASGFAQSQQRELEAMMEDQLLSQEDDEEEVGDHDDEGSSESGEDAKSVSEEEKGSGAESGSDEEGSEEEDGEEEGGKLNLQLLKKLEAERLALEAGRPPEGLRTRPGGQRVKQKSGEKYTRRESRNQKSTDIKRVGQQYAASVRRDLLGHSNAAAKAAADSEVADDYMPPDSVGVLGASERFNFTALDVRQTVKQDLERRKEKEDIRTALGKAYKGRNFMKDAAKTKGRELDKSAKRGDLW